MPINEAAGWRPSNLTPQQKREQTIAIFARPQELALNNADAPTIEELQYMRMMLAKYGSKQSKIQEFDLNKPPKEPYIYQEYPRMVYHHESHQTTIVKNKQQFDDATEQGWSKSPWGAVEAETPDLLTPQERAEAANVDAQLIKKKRV